MAVYQIQPSFAAGELSPAMAARVDLAKYAIGTRTMRNFYVHPHGGASNRPGTEYVASAKYPDKLCRLLPFKFSTVQSYSLEFGHLYIRFFKDGGVIVYPAGHPQAGQVVEIASPYTEDEVPYLKFTQSADVMYITHPNHPPQQLTRTAHHLWSMSAFPFKNGPFLTTNLGVNHKLTPNGTALNAAITLTSNVALFQAGHVGAFFKMSHSVAGASVAAALGSVTSSASIKVKGTWKIITHGKWVGKIKVERSKDNGASWQAIRYYSSGGPDGGDFNASDSGVEDEICLLRVTMYEWTSGACNADLSGFPYKLDGIVKITGVTNATTATATVTAELGGTGATDEWAEGAWSAVRGYPSTIVFYQDRLAMANSLYEPQTVWFSQTGDYINYGSSSPPKDDEAITATLASREVNEIRSLVSLGQIIGLTSAAEWKIGSASSSNALTPNSIRAQVEGYRGASWVDPAIIGNRILFVQDKGSTVRDLGYQYDVDGYTGSDISILSRHLVANHEIYEWAYQQEPESILWMIRDDGVLLGLTYMKEQEVIAWHRHDTDGAFESITTIPGNDRDEVWLVARRTINGSEVRYIERMAERLPRNMDVKKAWFVDSGLYYEGAATKEVSGLLHLEGKSVAVLADGNVLPNKTVVGGKVVLSTSAVSYTQVVVGLKITAELETLNVEVERKDGTAQGRPKRIPEVIVRMENSRGGWIGLDGNQENMDQIQAQIRDVWDEALPLYSGDVKMTIPGGYNIEGRIFIRQTDPLPMTILAVIPKVIM